MLSLHFQSDSMWAQFVEGRYGKGPELRRIKYMGGMLVNDYVTLKLVARYIVLDDIRELLLWPGISFSSESKEHRALLATYCCRLVFYFLVHYKNDLGIKHVKRVRLFTGIPFMAKVPGTDKTDTYISPQMLFEIEDVPVDKLKANPNWPLPSLVHAPNIPPPDTEAPPLHQVKLTPTPSLFGGPPTPSPSPEPVIPSPSTPRLIMPKPFLSLSSQDASPTVAHRVGREMNDDEFLRVHTFHRIWHGAICRGLDLTAVKKFLPRCARIWSRPQVRGQNSRHDIGIVV